MPSPVVARRPSASVLFFAYNHEAYVREALISVLRQEYDGFELIIVEDASTDGTRAIIEDLLAEEASAGVAVRRLYRNRNGGLISAVNEAMAVASGDIFMLMAGDDISMPCRLARTVRIFAEHPTVQVVVGEYVKIDEKGRPYASSAEAKTPQFFSYDSCSLTRIYGDSSPFGAAAAYRRRIFEVFGPMGEGSHGEDNCYWVRGLMLGEIYQDSACFVQWRQHAGNLSNFTAQLADPTWRSRHLQWMERHASMSVQWLMDINRAREIGVISWFRAKRLHCAALREDRSWALEASSLRRDPWSEWSGRAFRLLLVGRISTTFKMLKLRLFPWLQERRWRLWAKLKSNTLA